MIQEAINADMSIGKYNEYLKLKKCDDSYTIEDCKGMSIHEIHTKVQIHHAQQSHNMNHHD
ncbi:MAG: hypothetical protein PUF50_07485 [Erysipelotrichaceae bacterium]|nr:hypothetical protein [Erysipelotrichaceae bacterium]